MDFLIKVGESFSLADIDLDWLEKHTALEYVNFLPDPYRSDTRVYNDTYNGLAAEHYMVEEYGYTNDDRKYKDLFAPCGTSVEIKSGSSEETIQKHIETLTERKSWGPKYDISDYVICFLRDNKTYTCHSLWQWDGNNYVKVKEEPEEDRTEVIRKLERMPLEKARQVALQLMEDWNPQKIGGKASKNRTIYDIETACTSADICGIMYRLQLAYEGLGTIGSSWQNHYRNI